MLISLRERSQMGTLIGNPGEPLAETLRHTLLEMILFGYFEHETRLYPEKLAEQFGVSLTPVREALMRLAAEGFIEAVQRRGFHIRVPDAKRVTDLWQVRLSMELLAGELVIGRLAAGDLDARVVAELEALLVEMEVNPDNLSHRHKLELNGSFHQQIVKLSGNDLLISNYTAIQMQVLSAWIQRGLESWRLRHVAEAEEHRLMLAGLRDRNRRAYEAATRRHIGRSLKDALADLAVQDNDKMRAIQAR